MYKTEENERGELFITNGRGEKQNCEVRKGGGKGQDMQAESGCVKNAREG